MDQVDPGRLAEQGAGNERRAGDAGRGEIELAGISLGVGDQFLQILDRHLGIDDERQRRRTHASDADEILERIEREILAHQRSNRVAVRSEHQCVAVGRRFRDGRGPRKTGAVLDDDRLPPFLGKFVGQHTGRDVGYAAGAERHDDGNPLRGIALRRSRCDKGNRYQGRGEPEQPKYRHHRSSQICWRIHTLWPALWEAIKAGRKFRVYE